MGWKEERSSGSVLKVQLHPQVSLGAVCASLAWTWRQRRRENGAERSECSNPQRLKDVCGHRTADISKVLILDLVLPSPRAELSQGWRIPAVHTGETECE